MDPPLILELAVKVGVRGRSVGSPSPVVQNCHQLKFQNARWNSLFGFCQLKEPSYSIPADRTGTGCQVIDLEAGRTAHVTGLKADEPALLGEQQLLGMALSDVRVLSNVTLSSGR